MFSTKWIWYIASLTNVVYMLQLNDVQNVHHKRFKRKENTTKTTEISTEDYLQKYSFIVRIKSVQSASPRKKAKTTMMCMGTMLSANLVLTTDYCVRNAVSITVFLADNSEVKINITLISMANIAVKSGERKKFPNPLFYGDRVSMHYAWYSIYPKNDKTQSTRNVATVHLGRSLAEIRLTDTGTVYPAIVANPSNFVDQNRPIDAFGTSDLADNTIGKLVKFRFQAYPCESDAIFANSICVDPELYKKAIHDADQGAPVVLLTDDGDKNNNVTPSSLIAMVNTPKSDGCLIYLWPYAGWIRSVLEELFAFESWQPCPTEIVADAGSNKQLVIDSYYDFAESDKNEKTINPCSRAALAAVSPPVTFSSAIVIVFVVVVVVAAAR